MNKKKYEEPIVNLRLMTVSVLTASEGTDDDTIIGADEIFE